MEEKREQFIKTYFSSLPVVNLVGETAPGSGTFKYKTENKNGNPGYLFVFDKYINPPTDTIPETKPRKRKEKKAPAPKRKPRRSTEEDEADDEMGMPEPHDDDFDDDDIFDDGHDIGVSESKTSGPPPAPRPKTDRPLEYDPETGMIKDGQVHDMICDAFGSIVLQFKTHVNNLGPSDAATFDRIIRIWKEICDEAQDEPLPPQPRTPALIQPPTSTAHKPTKEDKLKNLDKIAMQFLRENKGKGDDDDFKIGGSEDEGDEDEGGEADDQFGGGGGDDDDSFYDSEFEAIFKSDGSDYYDEDDL